MVVPTSQSIIVIGGGWIGLSTVLALAQRPAYKATKIILIDVSDLPNELNSSWDINRIVRADYTNPLYAALAGKAMGLWRTSAWDVSSRYTESGLLLLGDTNATYITDALEIVKSRGEAGNVQEVAGEIEIIEACGTGGSSGTWGYVNRKAGWVDAARCMTFAYEEVKRIDRVEIVKGKAKRLAIDNTDQKDVL